ncbi:MAG: PH domain-containing protein [Thermodesulfobacteriota bacterium]
MNSNSYRVDTRLIPPVVLAMGFGAFLVYLEFMADNGLIVLAILAPFFYLGLEILARVITLDDSGITVTKFLRSVRVEWSDIEALDAVKSRTRLFLILQSRGAPPVLITNTIQPFRDLVAQLLERIPEAQVSATARETLTDPPSKHGPVVHAWLISALLAGLVAVRLMGY